MSLIDALKNPQPKPVAKSRMAQILSEVTGPEQQALLEALGSREWTDEGLADLLTAQGHSISASSVRRYRRASK